jgi:hypothetical protein
MYAQYDSEDGHDMLHKFNRAYDRSYIKEDDVERRVRERKEYDQMLLQPKQKLSKKEVMKPYDLMLMGWKTK